MHPNLGHLGQKSRSLGQIKEMPCGRSRGHISCSLDLKFCQNVCSDEILHKFNFGSPVIENYVTSLFLEIVCGHSGGHIYCSVDLKIGQDVCLDKTSDEFEFGSLWVKN